MHILLFSYVVCYIIFYLELCNYRTNFIILRYISTLYDSKYEKVGNNNYR